MPHERGISPDSSTEHPEPGRPAWREIALCRHETAGAPPHLDLFLAPVARDFGDQDRVLETWRLPSPPSTLGPGETMQIERIGTHRGLYVRLRQPRDLDRDRGRVTPVSEGRALVTGTDTGLSLEIRWSDGSVINLRIEPCEGPEGTRRLLRTAD